MLEDAAAGAVAAGGAGVGSTSRFTAAEVATDAEVAIVVGALVEAGSRFVLLRWVSSAASGR